MPNKSPNPVRPWMVASQKKKDSNARWANEAQGGVANQFYRNAPWRKLRERQLAKEPSCRHCADKGKLTPATVADHITPIRLGGEPLDIDNLMSLCKPCHASKSVKERYMPTPMGER